MRLLLDAHLSGNRIGAGLRARGHDVRALTDAPDAEGLEDEQVLALATSERRILITQDVSDFPDILRDWAASGRSHSGVILVFGIRAAEFGVIVRGVAGLLDETPRQTDWLDVVRALSRRASE